MDLLCFLEDYNSAIVAKYQITVTCKIMRYSK